MEFAESRIWVFFKKKKIKFFVFGKCWFQFLYFKILLKYSTILTLSQEMLVSVNHQTNMWQYKLGCGSGGHLLLCFSFVCLCRFVVFMFCDCTQDRDELIELCVSRTNMKYRISLVRILPLPLSISLVSILMLLCIRNFLCR